MSLTPEAAIELLNTCASQVAETEEAVEFGRALFALSKVDEALANRIVAACSAFSSEHVKIAAVVFYKAGRDAGIALARQQRRRPGSAGRLQ
jgi:predicted hydrocarbon binding protein